MRDISILEMLAKVRNGQGYFIVRNPVTGGQRPIEFFEAENE